MKYHASRSGKTAATRSFCDFIVRNPCVTSWASTESPLTRAQRTHHGGAWLVVLVCWWKIMEWCLLACARLLGRMHVAIRGNTWSKQRQVQVHRRIVYASGCCVSLPRVHASIWGKVCLTDAETYEYQVAGAPRISRALVSSISFEARPWGCPWAFSKPWKWPYVIRLYNRMTVAGTHAVDIA